MENNPQIIPLFPIPLYRIKIPNKFSLLTSFFNNQELQPSPPQQTNSFGERSKNTYILNEPECLDLNKYILNYSVSSIY